MCEKTVNVMLIVCLLAVIASKGWEMYSYKKGDKTHNFTIDCQKAPKASITLADGSKFKCYDN